MPIRSRSIMRRLAAALAALRRAARPRPPKVSQWRRTGVAFTIAYSCAAVLPTVSSVSSGQGSAEAPALARAAGEAEDGHERTYAPLRRLQVY